MAVRGSGFGVLLGLSLGLCQCGKVERGSAPSEVAVERAPRAEEMGGADFWSGAPGPTEAPLGSSCAREVRYPLSAVPDIAHERGLELERVLARATGEFTSVLRWSEQAEKLPQAPVADVPLTVRVLPGTGPAIYVEEHLYEGEDVQAPAELEEQQCPGRVELPVSVELQTQGGELNEHVDATLVMVRRVGVVVAWVPVAELRGNLGFPPFDVQDELPPTLALGLQVSELGTSGSLRVEQGPSGILARWPAENHCPSNQMLAPLDRVFDGFAIPRLASLLAQASPTAFEWGDGTPTTLSIAATPNGAGCAQEALEHGDLVHWWFDASLSAATADGVLNGPLAAAIHVAAYDDEFHVMLNADRSLAADDVLAVFPSATEVSRERGAFLDFDLHYSFDREANALLFTEGSLSLVTSPPPACDEERCDTQITLAEGSIPPLAD